HDHQRSEATFTHPAPRFEGVADGVGGAAIEINATLEHRLIARHEARQFLGARCRVDAADQQPLAAPSGEKLDSVADAFTTARERDNGVGRTLKAWFHLRNLGGVPEETADEGD